MNREQLKQLKEAISLIEKAGGVVIIDEEKIESEIELKEENEWIKLYAKQKEEAKKDFHEMLESGSSVFAIEEMILSHGLDLDELENFIHECY